MRFTSAIAIAAAIAASALERPAAAAEREMSSQAASGDIGKKQSLQSMINAAEPGTTIRVPAGVYREKVLVPREKRGLRIIHEGDGETVITHDDYAGRKGPDGTDLGTFRSYTFKVEADDVELVGLTIVNIASDENVAAGGRGVGQAVALHLEGDRIAVRKCLVRSYQDTLYATQGVKKWDASPSYSSHCRQYFEDCRIEGSVDFIFGQSTALFNRCELVHRISGVTTAAATPEGQKFGYVFYKCRLTAPNDQKSILGRPWRDFAQTVFLQCEISDCIKPEGWTTWRPGDGRDKTAYYGEFDCFGSGADVSKRPEWTHNTSSDRDAYFSARGCRDVLRDVLSGDDGWMPAADASAPVCSASFAEFDARAKRGERLSVVFFGGSLTYSANASDPNVTGLRGLMARYLEDRYPAAHFSFHDAAIGGTGSLLGAFRLERDVLAHKPDIVFLDFLCNDGTDTSDLAPTCAYEYILRELIGRGIPVEQMFFTFKFWAGKGFDPVKSLPRRNMYRTLADAYGTPVGDVRLESLGRDLESGKTSLDEVWPLDGAHPCDFGYQYFFEAVKAGFERGISEKAVCRVPVKPVFGTMRDVRRTRLLGDSGVSLPSGWKRQLAYRTSMWFDGLSSRWMGDVAVSKAGAAPIVFSSACNFVGFFGEGDENGLEFELADENGTLGRFKSSPGPGRLFIFRNHLMPGWEKGALEKVSYKVAPAGDGNGELHLESILTATLVPAVPAEGATAGSGKDSVEALDHARGMKAD